MDGSQEGSPDVGTRAEARRSGEGREQALSVEGLHGGRQGQAIDVGAGSDPRGQGIHRGLGAEGEGVGVASTRTVVLPSSSPPSVTTSSPGESPWITTYQVSSS